MDAARTTSHISPRNLQKKQSVDQPAHRSRYRRAYASLLKVGAAKSSDFTKAIVDTTVGKKNVAFPTDAKLCHRARERLVRQATDQGIKLRQSYKRVGKDALIMHQRYAHAKHYKRARKKLKTLKTYLGRTIRDIRRKIAGDEALEAGFLRPLWLAERVMTQKPRDPIPKKVYSLHAPEVKCIGKSLPLA